MEIHPLQFIDEQPPQLDADSLDVTAWQDAAGEDVVFCATFGPWHWLRVVGAGSYRFPVSTTGLAIKGQVVADAGASFSLVTDSYYRTVVPVALQAYGLETLHGSAVSLPGGVVALCAQPESGKSTIAFAMRERGHRAVADDSVVISLEERSPSRPGTAAEHTSPTRALIHPVPFALRLREPSAEHFDSPSKDVVRVTGNDDSGAVEPLPLAAVVLLSRCRAEADSTHGDGEPATAGTELTRLPRSAAFTALLGQSLAYSLVDKARRRQMMAAYLRLADVVPVYRLRYPTGLEHLGEICVRLEDLGRADAGRLARVAKAT